MSAPVLELLQALSKAVEAKDLDAAMSLWTDDGILAGSGEEELGVDGGVRDFLRAVFGTELVIGWSWQEPVVRGEGSIAWFYADGTLHVQGMKDRPYRASGVVRLVDGGWRFAMWCGATPD